MKPTMQFRWLVRRNQMPTAQELMEYRDQESLPMMEAKRRLLDEEAPVLQQWWESSDLNSGGMARRPH